MGQHEVAVQYIGRAIGLEGNVAAFHYNLGNTFRDLGKPDQAVACYRRALELSPDYAEVYSNLGMTLKDLRRGGRSRRLLPPRPGAAAGFRRGAQQPGRSTERTGEGWTRPSPATAERWN